MENQERQRGSVTLETSIVLPIFLFLFLSIYGLFIVIEAQNQMTHVLVQSTKSLSLDAYLTDNVESAAKAKTEFWGGLSDMVLDIVREDLMALPLKQKLMGKSLRSRSSMRSNIGLTFLEWEKFPWSRP